jgi:uncharacterized protein (DUF2249 family)
MSVAPLPSSAAESTLRHPPSAPVVEVDVREDLRSGREPFSRIMSAVSALHHGDVLHLRATFEPAPLFAVMGEQGFLHESLAHAADDWSVWFWRPDTAANARDQMDRPREAGSNHPPSTSSTQMANDMVVLDVRVIPPRDKHPTIFRTFDGLANGQSMLIINDHDPRPLRYQFAAERADLFEWTYEAEGPSVWRVRIDHR